MILSDHCPVADEVPKSKEEGWARWKFEMEMRFVRGEDADFDYKTVDEDESLDDETRKSAVAISRAVAKRLSGSIAQARATTSATSGGTNVGGSAGTPSLIARTMICAGADSGHGSVPISAIQKW